MSTPGQKITSRQQTVIDGIKAKKTPQAIAAEMGISVNGVYGHMRRLRKTGLLPAEKASTNGKSTPARKAGARKPARTSRPRASRNGSRRNGRKATNPVVEALRAANEKADNRLAEIEAQIKALDAERGHIVSARS